MLSVRRDAQIMCFQPYRENSTETDQGFLKEEAVDPQREGFPWWKQEAGRIPGMEKEHGIDLEIVLYPDYTKGIGRE